MNYRVSDLIIRIKNATLAHRRRVSIDNLRINKNICRVLVDEGFLKSVETDIEDGRKVLVAKIKYEKRIPVLTDVSIVSKPSLRKYTMARKIPELHRRGRYTVVLSTNKGIMTAREAQKKNLGGEILFKIW